MVISRLPPGLKVLLFLQQFKHLFRWKAMEDCKSEINKMDNILHFVEVLQSENGKPALIIKLVKNILEADSRSPTKTILVIVASKNTRKNLKKLLAEHLRYANYLACVIEGIDLDLSAAAQNKIVVVSEDELVAANLGMYNISSYKKTQTSRNKFQVHKMQTLS